MGPDFLGIGAQKAGTTWLFQMLRAHPDIWLPPVKELHYFDHYPLQPTTLWQRRRWPKPRIWRRHFKQRSVDTVAAAMHVLSAGRVTWGPKDAWRLASLAGVRQHPTRLASDLLWDVNYFGRRRTDAWYQRLFPSHSTRITGEITPGYAALSDENVAHVRGVVPDARIIFIMRDPIERAWAWARVLSRQGHLDLHDDAQIARFLRRPSVIARTDYLGTLAIWERHYDSSRIFLAFTDELQDCPEDLLVRLYRFLGVDASSSHVPRYARQIVHRGAPVARPASASQQLAESYYPQLQQLHRRFGGYTSRWLHSAEAILNHRR